jgi:hypothetical protein
MQSVQACLDVSSSHEHVLVHQKGSQMTFSHWQAEGSVDVEDALVQVDALAELAEMRRMKVVSETATADPSS